MKIDIVQTVDDYNSYRAARVKSLFNCTDGHTFKLSAEIPIDSFDWKVGLIVGPSGSGKTSIARRLLPGVPVRSQDEGWDDSKPLIDNIGPSRNFDEVTAALSAVGLGSVPAWLRPYGVLSNGEKFRADLARVICEETPTFIIDEFTSVVDRQIAQFGASAFQKSMRREKDRRAVLVSCHYDIAEWLEPDWIFDTKDLVFSRRSLRRPKFELEIIKTDRRYWRYFEPHYYLTLPSMVAAEYFVGTVDGEIVAHLGVAPAFHQGRYRASRLVVMPEWQGVGVGLRFLNAVCQVHLEGQGRQGRKLPTIFHTSHPGLCAAFRRDPKWRQKSSALFGGNKAKSQRTFKASGCIGAGFGGHMRAVQGFEYIGVRE